jgi:type IV secretory pathway VirB4 component
MLRLDKVLKPWKESAALNAHINLFGFWNETAFLTKSGDVGMVLSVPGVDYESLDRSEQAYAVKRLEAALKGFGPGFHVYQYLFKSNCPDIPFAKYDDPKNSPPRPAPRNCASPRTVLRTCCSTSPSSASHTIRCLTRKAPLRLRR